MPRIPDELRYNTGVYRICNMVNGKRYIGSAAESFETRWIVHKSSLRGGYHHSRHLQGAWNKYGEEAFIFEIVVRCPPDKCVELEQLWMDKERVADQEYGYNMHPTARSPLGFKHTPEACAKIGAAHKGMKHSAEAKAKMSAKRKGIVPVAATKAAAEANRGRKRPKEECERIAAAHRGKTKSEAHKAAISAAKKGKPPSVKAKAANEARRGVPLSEERRRKISEGNYRKWAMIKAQAQQQQEE